MIQSNVLNCGSGLAGTWFDGCNPTPKDFTKVFLKSPSAKINLTSDVFDADAIALLIKKGQLVPLNDTLQIMDVAAKNNFQTLANKKKIYISQGLYDFTIGFEANPCLVKALHLLTKKKWELILLDSEGKLFFDNKGGFLNGFEINDFSVENETVNDGGSKFAMVDCSIQLSQNGTKGYNERKSYMVSTDTLDFYSVNGVQNVKISATVLTATGFKVKVVGGCDGTTPILGLALTNFRQLNATTGAVVALTAVVDNNDGTYTLTGATAGDKTFQLYDLVVNSAIADIEKTQFFQSNVLAVTVV
ncbi:MAG: hypothetical protein H7101_11305 [Deinococcales bacterium]|nr:hypothetical protein [Chitinophagaceae bacterium]